MTHKEVVDGIIAMLDGLNENTAKFLKPSAWRIKDPTMRRMIEESRTLAAKKWLEHITAKLKMQQFS